MSIEAMKQALEALESCGEDEWYTEDDFGMSQTYDEKKVENAITSLRQAIAEEEKQEPVACHTCKGLGRIYMGCGSWIHCDTCNTTGKATTPPKREPLTDEQIATISVECATVSPSDIYFARAIEAAHGIKEEA